MHPRSWQLRHNLWQLPTEGAIMGILNTTPDSFSDGGLHDTLAPALAHAQHLISEGAHIIDIGGESTRPGATPTDSATEQSRVLPVIQALRQQHPNILISIDTRHADTAALALDAGADIINDITALTDPAMLQLCASRPCGIVLMHSCAQDEITPETIVPAVRCFFEERVATLTASGISPSRLCLDPGIGFGIGFGKTAPHSLQLIRHLEAIRVANCPILMALSRKRFIGTLLTGTPAPVLDPLPTAVLALLSAQAGADLHRVHDIAPTKQALHLRQTIDSLPHSS